MTTGERMKVRRKEAGISVDEIAAALNVSVATVYRYENGEIEKVPGSVLEPLAKVLRTTPHYLMGWDTSDIELPHRLTEELSNQAQMKELQVALKIMSSPEMQSLYKEAKELAKLQAKLPAEAIGLSMDEEKNVIGVNTNLFFKEKTSTPEFSLSPAGQRIGYAYEKAPQREQSIVEQVLEPYIDDTEDVIYIKWRISEQAAAAGNGIYLGPETFTEYEVDESKLPRGAAFGVPISGDSMEPEYHDGDIAIISKDFPEIGQVGLFTYDGNGYIKKRGDGVLESLNPEYDDIPITNEVIINGRVLGVITWDDVRK